LAATNKAIAEKRKIYRGKLSELYKVDASFVSPNLKEGKLNESIENHHSQIQSSPPPPPLVVSSKLGHKPVSE